MKRIRQIRPASRDAARSARGRWNQVAKPLGSFGILEDLVVQLSAVQGTAQPCIRERTAVVMCADHGVVSEGVSQSGQDVTALSTAAIAAGRSNINALAEVYGVRVLAVDIAVAHDFPAGTDVIRDPAALSAGKDGPQSDVGAASGKAGARGMADHAAAGAVLDRKIAHGSGNIARECAMTPEQAQQAIVTGLDLVRDLKDGGTKIIVTGEMGIGNTTIASALASVCLGLPAEQVTGRGAGLSTQALARKTAIVKQAIALHRPDERDPLDLLSKIGGYDVAGMCGLFLGGAFYGVPVIIDGAISAAAAYLAYLMNPLSVQYMLPGHCSAEPAGRLFLEKLGLSAPIDGQLRLGEGTGGILLLPLLDGALALYRNAHTFVGLGIEAYQKLT